MITKGIVEEVLEYKAKVRIPIYDSIPGSKYSSNSSELTSATICSLPNINYIVSKGDIVWISFEDDDLNKPIILGHLYRAKGNISTPGLTLSTLTTTSTTKLNEDTYIGKIKPDEIGMLTGIQGNIQAQINRLDDTTKFILKDYVSLNNQQEILSDTTFNNSITFKNNIILDKAIIFNGWALYINDSGNLVIEPAPSDSTENETNNWIQNLPYYDGTLGDGDDDYTQEV